MNWMGGARHRIKNKQDLKKQEEFFNKVRKEKLLNKDPTKVPSSDQFFLDRVGRDASKVLNQNKQLKKEWFPAKIKSSFQPSIKIPKTSPSFKPSLVFEGPSNSLKLNDWCRAITKQQKEEDELQNVEIKGQSSHLQSSVQTIINSKQNERTEFSEVSSQSESSRESGDNPCHPILYFSPINEERKSENEMRFNKTISGPIISSAESPSYITSSDEGPLSSSQNIQSWIESQKQSFDSIEDVLEKPEERIFREWMHAEILNQLLYNYKENEFQNTTEKDVSHFKALQRSPKEYKDIGIQTDLLGNNNSQSKSQHTCGCINIKISDHLKNKTPKIEFSKQTLPSIKKPWNTV